MRNICKSENVMRGTITGVSREFLACARTLGQDVPDEGDVEVPGEVVPERARGSQVVRGWSGMTLILQRRPWLAVRDGIKGVLFLATFRPWSRLS